MSKAWTPNKKTVELAAGAARPSKIRREPPPSPATRSMLTLPEGRERETWTVVIGVVMFAIAISFLIIWISDYTSQ